MKNFMMISKIKFKTGICIMVVTALMMPACTESTKTTVNTVHSSGDTLSKTVLHKTESKPALSGRDTTQYAADANDALFVVSTEATGHTVKSTIEISCKKKTTRIAKVEGEVSMIDRSDYNSKGIPPDAVSACDASAKGRGHYFYFVTPADSLLVYEARQDSTQRGMDLIWKKIISKHQ